MTLGLMKVTGCWEHDILICAGVILYAVTTASQWPVTPDWRNLDYYQSRYIWGKIYWASQVMVSIASVDGLLPVHHHAIYWTDAD